MARLGQYELGQLLGEGGIGQVHAAFDTILKREVAIKSLRPEKLTDANFVARFHAEATSLARLNHPNITTVHTLLVEGRNLYMVMERVRGVTLDDLLRRRSSPMSVRESVALIGQAAAGLAYAHAMGVIHRDIKPANLMVTDGGLVKIMDFGIARARGSQRLTRDGSIIGTLAYMAPEQLRGEPGDERSDLYSLAVVLYEMLAGAAPFSSETEYGLMQAQIHERPRRPSTIVPDMEGRVERALMQALAKRPDQRQTSVNAFREALGAGASPHAPAFVADDETATHARTGWRPLSSLAEQLTWLPARIRVPAVAGGLVLAAVGLGLIAYEVTAAEPEETASSPSTAPVRASSSLQSASPPGPIASEQSPAILQPSRGLSAPPAILSKP
jgi:eukaryotic-like serine/threonine-protein kinase